MVLLLGAIAEMRSCTSQEELMATSVECFSVQVEVGDGGGGHIGQTGDDGVVESTAVSGEHDELAAAVGVAQRAFPRDGVELPFHPLGHVQEMAAHGVGGVLGIAGGDGFDQRAVIGRAQGPALVARPFGALGEVAPLPLGRRAALSPRGAH